MLKIILILIPLLSFADSRNVVGNLNKIRPDPAEAEVKRETKKLRDELNNLDRPKKIEKTPNQIKEEQKKSE